MAGISDILAELDRLKKLGLSRGRDMVTNTGDYLTQMGDNMRNMQMGREAVASGGSLGYRDLTEEEKIRRMTEGALDSFGGGLGTVRKVVSRAAPKVAAPVAEGMLPRTRDALKAAGVEPDMIEPLMRDTAYKEGFPKEFIDRSMKNRASYRAQPATTPGPNASEDEWAKWGEQFGLSNFRVTEPVSTGVSDVLHKREIKIPGGTEGTFTIPDLFYLKGNTFNPDALPQDVGDAIYKKLFRTYQPDPNIPMSPENLFTTHAFGQLSPEANLTPNIMQAMMQRPRNMDELSRIAGQASMSDAERTALYGAQAKGKGGMGIRGNPKFSDQPPLAAAILAKPDMFYAAPGETMRDVSARMSNQIPGLSQKTGGLTSYMTDLNKGDSAAIDVHHMREFIPKLLRREGVGADFLADSNRLLGTNYTPDELIARMELERVNPTMAQTTLEKVRGLVETTEGGKYRYKTGELNDVVKNHPAIQPERLMYEPKDVQVPGRYYEEMLNIMGEEKSPNFNLGPGQWRKWDPVRARLEPHEFLHPDYQKLPRSSWSEMYDALNAHSNAGFLANTKNGTKLPIATTDWRKLYYGNANPQLLGGMALGGGGLMAYDAMQDGESEGTLDRLTRFLRERQGMGQ